MGTGPSSFSFSAGSVVFVLLLAEGALLLPTAGDEFSDNLDVFCACGEMFGSGACSGGSGLG